VGNVKDNGRKRKIKSTEVEEAKRTGTRKIVSRALHFWV
jgi:hypothetical protein